MSGNSEKKWYVVKAVTGKEKKVKEYLESEINRLNLQNSIFSILIPMEKVYEVRNGKKVSKERTFLSGYVLVEAALVGMDRILDIIRICSIEIHDAFKVFAAPVKV